MTSAQLIARLMEARARQLQVFDDLEGEALLGREQHHLEPPIWEMGHVAWFQELYLLRKLDRSEPIFAAGDGMYDSFKVSYRQRWSHDFPDKAATLAYAHEVLERSIARLQAREPGEDESYLYQLVADHESMHTENLVGIRQELGYALPGRPVPSVADYQPRDLHVQGGRFLLGAPKSGAYVLDNEQWAHEVEVDDFSMASTALRCGEFADFLDADAYNTRSLWSRDGWNWRRRAEIAGPLYWQKRDGLWHERHFASWRPIRPYHPLCHVNLHEARAYCRFANRRLPSEAEWEMAATWDPVAKQKRRYPWGDEEPDAERVHMDLGAGDTIDVRAKPAGDSALGFRQMIGNVWEWTDSKLVAYPGYQPGPYADYSQPYLGKKPVLRGGAWTTSTWLIRSTWRNFFIKHRRNIFAGLRTCARRAGDPNP